MASNAMRAKTTLPWRLLSAHRRSIRTLHRRDADASCSGSAGTSGWRLREQSCAYCARVSFSSMYVALVRPFSLSKLSVVLSGQLVADRPQCVPLAFNCSRDAVARSGVQISTAAGTYSFAIFAAEHETGRRQEPGFANSRTEIERHRVRVERIDIRIVRSVVTFRREDEVRFLVDLDAHFCQAAATRYQSLATDSAAEVEARRTGGGQAAFDPDRLFRARVSGLPHRVVRRELSIDMRRL